MQTDPSSLDHSICEFPSRIGKLHAGLWASKPQDSLGLLVWHWFEQRSQCTSRTHNMLSGMADATDHAKLPTLYDLYKIGMQVHSKATPRLGDRTRLATAGQLPSPKQTGCTNPSVFMGYLVHKRLILLLLCELRFAMWPGAHGFIMLFKKLVIPLTLNTPFGFPLSSMHIQTERYLRQSALFHSCSLTLRIFWISWSGKWFMCNRDCISHASPGHSRFITHCTLEPNHDASFKGWFCTHTLMTPIQRVAGI